MIRLITFDLDETLWGGTEVVLRAETEMVKWVSEKVPTFPEQYRTRAADVRVATLAKRPRIHLRLQQNSCCRCRRSPPRVWAPIW